jgi:Protein of unknown function (DUF2695)
MKTIAELRALLMSAQRLTAQSSYERRAPSPKSVPALLAAKSEVIQFLDKNAESTEAHRLLSMAQECLLNYPAARRSFEAALLLLNQRNPKDLKHLALLKEYESKWVDFPLTPEELASLGHFLAASLSETGCNNSAEQTKQWLTKHSPSKMEAKLKAIRHWGGYCDCEVLANVV